MHAGGKTSLIRFLELRLQPSMGISFNFVCFFSRAFSDLKIRVILSKQTWSFLLTTWTQRSKQPKKFIVYCVTLNAVHFVMYCARLLWSIAYFVCYSVNFDLAGSHDGFNPFRRKSQECPASVKRSFHKQLVDWEVGRLLDKKWKRLTSGWKEGFDMEISGEGREKWGSLGVGAVDDQHLVNYFNDYIWVFESLV